MGYLIAAIIVFLGCYRQNSKVVTYIIAFYIWSLIAFNVGTTDYYAFEEMFYCAFEPRYSMHEPGFLFLCQIMNHAGFTFLQFRMVIAGVIVFLILEGMRPFTKQMNYALALFLIFPLGGMVSRLRYAMGAAVIIFGMKYIFFDIRFATFKYILCVTFAVLFHYSAVIYLLFLLAKGRKIQLPVFVILITSIFAGTIFFLKSGVAYKITKQIIDSSKVLNWLQPEKFGYYISPLYIISLVLFSSLIFLLYLCHGIFGNRKNINKIVMIKIELLSIVGILLSIISSVVFMRITVTTLPVAYAILSEGFVVGHSEEPRIQNQNRMMKLIMPAMALMTALFAYGYWISESFLKIYQDNMIFGRIG